MHHRYVIVCKDGTCLYQVILYIICGDYNSLCALSTLEFSQIVLTQIASKLMIGDLS